MGLYKNPAYVSTRFALELDHNDNGWVMSVDGGGLTGDIVTEKAGAHFLTHKHIGSVSYDDITIECGLGMGEPFFKWISDTLNLNYGYHDGAIHYADSDGRVMRSLEFYKALLSSITFPALDASSKDQAKLTFKIQPEYTKNMEGTGQKITPSTAPIAPDKSKKWLLSNFRLRIDGLDEACRKVTKIDALTITQTNSDADVGISRFAEKIPGTLTMPDLAVTLPEGSAEPFFAWMRKFAVDGNSAEEQEKTATLELLSNDLKTVLATIEFHHLGIYKLTPDKVTAAASTSGVIRNVKVTMYCERISLKFDSKNSAA